MDTTWQTRRRLGTFAWAMAWFGLVAGQLHALARHRTADGKSDLDLPLTRFWAEPAGDALNPLFDWANPDAVYLTYGKVWLPAFAAMAACAVVVYRLRAPSGFEKWSWRIAITGYVALALGAGITYWTQWTGFTAMADVGLAAVAPGMLLSLIGSTCLGIALLRAGFRPRSVPILLVTAIPALLLISAITSLGNAFLPTAFAFGILGRELARDPAAGERLAARKRDVRVPVRA